MKKMFKSKGIKFFLGSIILFVAYNIFWYVMTQCKYEEYSEGMEKISWITYYEYGEEFMYSVKYPGYSSFVGNLTISDSNYDVMLFIWPKSLWEEESYGFMFNNEEGSPQIMVDKNLKAEYPEDQALVDSYKEKEIILFEEANRKWDIFEE